MYRDRGFGPKALWRRGCGREGSSALDLSFGRSLKDLARFGPKAPRLQG